MKPAPPREIEAADLDATPDCDIEDFKDVYWPDVGTAPDEPPCAFKLRCAFANASYRVRKVEQAETHPVLIVRAVRTDACRIAAQWLLWRHIRNILRQAGFDVKRDELIIDQTGDRILVAFRWPDSPIDYAAGLRQAELDAAEFAEMPL